MASEHPARAPAPSAPAVDLSQRDSEALAQELARLRAENRTLQRLAAIGELVAGLAHELSTPLSYLRSNLEYVAAQLETLPELERDLPEAVKDSQDATERLCALVADLKGMSREEQNRLPIELEETIRSSLRLAAAPLATCNVALEVEPGLNVEGDRGRLAQVFINLIVNAAHAVEPEPPERRNVSVRGWREAGKAIVHVSDTGGGIREDALGKIFDPFFTTKKAGKGTGLGLPISLGIVTEHGGTLSVHATGPGGTTFRVELPLAQG